MITYLIVILLVIIFYFFYRNYKYNNYLKELNAEHFSMKKSNKISIKKEIPSNPNIIFCDNYGNINFIKDNKFTLINCKGEIIKNNININDVFKIPYSTNIKCGTKYGKYLLIYTKEHEIIEYDLIENNLTRDSFKDYFKNIDVKIDNILFMNGYFYIFSDKDIIIYDKLNNEIISKSNLDTQFKNAPKKFSAVFLNNNILYKNKPYGSPCFFRNKDLFIYDVKREDTYYTNIDNGFISNTDYNIVKYSQSKATYKVETSGNYRIICVGGGLENGGYGGYVFNDYELNKGEKLDLCVGGSGERIPLKDNLIITDKLPYTSSSAGSGGTFVYKDNKLLICAGGGGGWSSEIIKAPMICNSCFSQKKIYNKIIIPIKKMVLVTKNTDYHKKNNIKQRIIINDFNINCYNYNTVDYSVKEYPQFSNKSNLFETSYNNINDTSSISFDFTNVLSDYNFSIDCKIESTNNDDNDCDLHIYDEQNRILVIKDFINKFNKTTINSRKIISLFVKYPQTLNDFYVSSGNKTSEKYEDLFENMGPNSLDYPNIKLNGGLGGGGYSYINKSKKIVSCGGGGGYKGGIYSALSDDENEYVRKHLNIDYICGIGGLSYVKNNRFDVKHFINDYSNSNGCIIIIKIKELQKLGKVENDSYLEKEDKMIDPLNYFIKNQNKDSLNFDVNIPSLNRNISLNNENTKLNTIDDSLSEGINYYKVKIFPSKYDKIKIFVKCKYDIEMMLMYFSTKTLNRSIIKEDVIKKDNILSLNHGMIDPSLINIFTFLEKLIKDNIYTFNGNVKSKNIKTKNLFDNKDLIYNKSKTFLFTLDLIKIKEVDFLYILANSFKKSDIKINILQYNSKLKQIKDSEIEVQLKTL
jgi:hypothetical protein